MTEQSRRSVSRRDLARQEGFTKISPDLSQLDEAAFDELFEASPDDALSLVTAMTQATDRGLARLAQRLAGRLVLDVARTGPISKRGIGKLKNGPAGTTSELDIDNSMDAIVEAKARGVNPDLRDLTARRWEKPATAICLVVDQSGSMDGERLASATLAAAVCSWRAPQDYGVLAFSNRVIEIKPLDKFCEPSSVVHKVLALRGHGTTDLALALVAARRQLAKSGATRRITVLISDSEVTTGEDPTGPARALDELVILAPSDEPQHAQALAAAVGGTVTTVGGPMSVLAALNQVIS